MNATEAKKTLFEIRKNLIDDKQKHAIWLAIKGILFLTNIKRPKVLQILMLIICLSMRRLLNNVRGLNDYSL